jgi:hypothetical protein
MKLSGNHLACLALGGVALWALFVVWLAVVTKDAGYITLFFVPALGLRFLPMSGDRS